ncbi:hypothetical protein [Nonomuraea typhae]|uniref:Uncharacterized protein n=1 Tax=Nonomuraea typhae TaxID=2603600 RepID=A0ABW7Z2L7_9ACTN
MNPIRFERRDRFVTAYLPGDAPPVEVHWDGLYQDWTGEPRTPFTEFAIDTCEREEMAVLEGDELLIDLTVGMDLDTTTALTVISPGDWDARLAELATEFDYRVLEYEALVPSLDGMAAFLGAMARLSALATPEARSTPPDPPPGG